MSDVPIPKEMPQGEPLPATAPATPEAVPAQAQPEPTLTIDRNNARQALEAIAKPTGEATQTTTETGARLELNAEKMSQALNDEANFFLETGDRRLIFTALASSVGSTPLGSELKADVLRMVNDIPTGNLAPEQQSHLVTLKETVASLGLPAPDPEKNTFATFLESHNTNNPDKPIPPELISAVRAGQVEHTPLLAQALADDSRLSEQLWKELLPEASPRPDLTSPDGVLTAANLPLTDENKIKVQNMLRPLVQPGRKPKEFNISGMIMPSVLGGAMAIMFLTQLMAPEGQSNAGH